MFGVCFAWWRGLLWFPTHRKERDEWATRLTCGGAGVIFGAKGLMLVLEEVNHGQCC
jgi:hypothetical protein